MEVYNITFGAPFFANIDVKDMCKKERLENNISMSMSTWFYKIRPLFPMYIAISSGSATTPFNLIVQLGLDLKLNTKIGLNHHPPPPPPTHHELFKHPT